MVRVGLTQCRMVDLCQEHVRAEVEVAVQFALLLHVDQAHLSNLLMVQRFLISRGVVLMGLCAMAPAETLFTANVKLQIVVNNNLKTTNY